MIYGGQIDFRHLIVIDLIRGGDIDILVTRLSCDVAGDLIYGTFPGSSFVWPCLAVLRSSGFYFRDIDSYFSLVVVM